MLRWIAIALLMATSGAHADATLRPTDPLIGGWCEVEHSALLKRGSCDNLVIEQSSYSGVEETCAFLEIKRIRDGIEAHVECSNDGVLPYAYRFAKVTFQIVGNRLKSRELATHSAIKQASCVTVQPTPDGYLNLRDGPGMTFKVKAKLIIGEHLEVDARTDEWTHTTNVAERRGDAGKVSGWVYSKYVKETESCHVP
jgi:hypothetical protein